MPLTTVGTSMVSSGGGSVATNTALGNTALNANTTGSESVALGSQSLLSNTTGSYNVAVGQGALRANTTAQENTAVGNNSLRSNTTGGVNTAVGASALFANTTATRNTAVGYIAGSALTTGSANAVLGDNALKTATTAEGCVAVGTYALAATNGIHNTGVGAGSGELITTGTKNSILGRYNGNQGGLDIRTLSNRIVLSDGDGNPRGIFDSDGSFYVGLTPPPGYGGNAAYVITYLGSTRPAMRLYDTLTGSTPSTVINFVRNGNSVGQIFTTDTATSYVTSSDYRLKENVQPMTGALAKVSQLKPCTYTWKSSGSAGQGFIAHELQEVVPEGVYGEKDGVDKDGNPEYQGIDTSFLVATLTAAIQEQQAIITDLKARIETLEAK
jgi:trimeric autotransporter adhesin